MKPFAPAFAKTLRARLATTFAGSVITTLAGSVIATTFAGCVTVQSRTEVVVAIDVENALRGRVEELIISVEGGTSHASYTTQYAQRLRALADYPVEVVVAPERDDASRVYAVSVIARSGSAIVGRYRVQGGYRRGETTRVFVLLDAACETVAASCREDESCREGVCFALPEEGVDAGITDAGDASIRDAFLGCGGPGDCPARPCQNATCTGGACVYTSRCGAGEMCCGDVCAANCDCVGRDPGTTCRAAEGDCDVEERCDGVAPACPPDALRLFGPCRAAVNSCDAEEVCTGASKQCPPDAFVSAGLDCGGGRRCDGAGTCSLDCTPGPCDVSERPCAVGVYNCSMNRCVETGVAPAGTVCRAAANGCDRAETCDGSSAICPEVNRVEPATTLCTIDREPSGPCRAPTRCEGTRAECVAGAFLPAGTVCGSSGPCEALTCNGTSATCQRAFLDSSTICRPARTERGVTCDIAETCTGSSAGCPTDTVQPSGTVCRPALDSQCDFNEVCDGVTATCPSNSDVPNRTPCVSLGECGECQEGLCSPIGCPGGQSCCPSQGMCIPSDLAC